MEFLETFETHHNLRNNSAPDHIVTKEEFEEYYNNVSCSIDNDQYFELMMNNAWKINDGDRTYGKAWANEDAKAGPPKSGAGQRQGGAGGAGAGSGGFQTSSNSYGTSFSPQKGTRGGNQQAQKSSGAPAENMNYSDKQLCEEFRRALAARGARGIMGLGRQFKIADDNRSKDLDEEEFKKAVHDFRVKVSPKDAVRLFRIFDRDSSGAINYDEFLRAVRGDMN